MAPVVLAAVVVAALAVLSTIRGAGAQDMEPRAYSATPVGTNFLITGYTYTTGGVSTDPSLPIANVQASFDTGTIAYSRTFALAGRAVSAAALLPYVWGDFSGQVQEQNREVSRSGQAT